MSVGVRERESVSAWEHERAEERGMEGERERERDREREEGERKSR